MSLNNIRLTPRQVADLYSRSLVETKGVSFFGGNAQNILVLADKPGNLFLPENELQFLNNVLLACKLTVNDVAIINLDRNDSVKEIFSTLKPKAALLFAVAPLRIGLPMHFPPFQLQVFNGCTYLSAPSLSALEQDTAQKKKFWACLKELFGL